MRKEETYEKWPRERERKREKTRSSRINMYSTSASTELNRINGITYLRSHFLRVPQYHILLSNIFQFWHSFPKRRNGTCWKIFWFWLRRFIQNYMERDKNIFFPFMYLVDYLHTYFILIFHLENKVRFFTCLFIY